MAGASVVELLEYYWNRVPRLDPAWVPALMWKELPPYEELKFGDIACSNRGWTNQHTGRYVLTHDLARFYRLWSEK